MKKIILSVLLLVFTGSALIFAQTESDAYTKKLDSLQAKISIIKALPAEEQNQYQAVLAEVENRKNTLRSLLKTPANKRDKAWEELWNQNYSKAANKLDKIPVK